MENLIINTNLHKQSKSLTLVKELEKAFQAHHGQIEILHLADYPLPLCDGGPSFGHENVKRVSEKIQAASGLTLISPIYNYQYNAAAKNLIEVTGQAWKEKIVSFLCHAGGEKSYMSVMPVANMLMLDFRCMIIPRFVYAISGQYDESGVLDSDLKTRIQKLAQTQLKWVEAVPRG